MAFADTATLTVALNLDNNLTPGLKNAQGTVKRFGGGLDGAGKRVKSFAGTLAKAGAVAAGVFAGGLVVAIKSGIQDLATLESATMSVDAAIKQMGKTGKVTSGQVAQWANEIESDIGAAFDDKEIVAATSTLLRFGKVTSKNIKPAMVVMTDLAAKTGDVASASSLLAKALADPAKAAGRLVRVGIKLTDAQQKRIAGYLKEGKLGKAQAVILNAIAKSTKGAAEATQGPYQRALSTLSDVAEDARKALAEGFLPVIQRVADKLSKGLADPKVMQNIRDFGKGLANAFDDAVKFVEGIDWDAVGSGLKSAFSWGQKFVGVFNSLPPETKGLIIGLAGLTKLTGGAPIKIAVDFAKDALSGVFGHFFDRGSSPANPLWVQQKGLPVGGDGPDGSTGLLSQLKGLVKFGIVAAVPIAVATAGAAITKEIGDGISSWVANGNKNLEGFLKSGFAQFSAALNPIGTVLTNLDTNIKNLGQIPGDIGRIVDFVTGKPAPLPGAGTGTNFTGGRGGPGGGVDTSKLENKTDAVKTAVDNTKSAVVGSQGKLDTSIQSARAATHAAGEKTRAAEIASMNAFREGERATLSGINSSKNAITSRLGTANERLAQIRAKRMSFTTHVTAVANVSVRNVNNTTKTYTSYGGSRTMNTAL